MACLAEKTWPIKGGHRAQLLVSASNNIEHFGTAPERRPYPLLVALITFTLISRVLLVEPNNGPPLVFARRSPILRPSLTSIVFLAC